MRIEKPAALYVSGEVASSPPLNYQPLCTTERSAAGAGKLSTAHLQEHTKIQLCSIQGLIIIHLQVVLNVSG